MKSSNTDKAYKPDILDKLVPKNPDYKSFIQEKLKGQHFMRHIGFDLTLIEPGYIEGRAPIKPFLTQQDGFIHGGVTSTVADIVCGFAAFSLVSKEEHVVTGNLNIAYLSPGKGDYIMAKGYVIKPGKRMNFCEGEVWVETESEEEDDKLIAKISANMPAFKPGKD